MLHSSLISVPISSLAPVKRFWRIILYPGTKHWPAFLPPSRAPSSNFLLFQCYYYPAIYQARLSRNSKKSSDRTKVTLSKPIINIKSTVISHFLSHSLISQLPSSFPSPKSFYWPTGLPSSFLFETLTSFLQKLFYHASKKYFILSVTLYQSSIFSNFTKTVPSMPHNQMLTILEFQASLSTLRNWGLWTLVRYFCPSLHLNLLELYLGGSSTTGIKAQLA